MKDLISVATKFRDAFTYDPGHSDLDNEQPIHVTVTLGDWRALNFILGQIARAEQSHGPNSELDAALAACALHRGPRSDDGAVDPGELEAGMGQGPGKAGHDLPRRSGVAMSDSSRVSRSGNTPNRRQS